MSQPKSPNTLLQFLLFGFIGASGIIVDLLVVVLCREVFQLDVRIGSVPAYILAVTWNFELNRRITFQQESAELSWLQAYFSFVLICSLGFGVRWVTTHLCIEYGGLRGDRFLALSLNYLDRAATPTGTPTSLLQTPLIRLSYVANILGIGVASLFNFFGSKLYAFAPKKEPPQK